MSNDLVVPQNENVQNVFSRMLVTMSQLKKVKCYAKYPFTSALLQSINLFLA